jgi:hypothetical protein
VISYNPVINFGDDMKKIICINALFIIISSVSSFSQLNWTSNIEAHLGSLAPNVVAFGVRSDASDGYDFQYDQPNPPDPLGDFVKLYFPHVGGNWPENLGTQYCIDYKGITDPVWDFSVESTIEGSVTLKWDSIYINTLDTKIQLFLVDLTTLTRINKRVKGSYSFSYTEKRDFRIQGTIKVDIKYLIEGFWNGTTQIQDTVRAYLAQSNPPYSFRDSVKIFLSTSGTGMAVFPNAITGNYYLVIAHRNHLEVWSALPLTLTKGTTSYAAYNFSTGTNKAYGTNALKQVGAVYVGYGGDVNQDGVVDIFDLIALDNDNAICRTGYISTDTNGDSVVDIFDLIITDNNNAIAVTKQRP